MLFWLSQYLSADYSFLNAFNYITLRSVLAILTAAILSLLVGNKVIDWLKAKKIGQAVRDDGPQTHLKKDGTPTMGGILILLSIAFSTLLWADLTNKFVWVVLIITVGFGLIGWYDDWKKVVYHDPHGLSAKWKYFWQSVLGIGAALFLVFSDSSENSVQMELLLPFFKTVAYPLGIVGFVILTYFVIVGSSNAVNLTDGLDGLAIMPTVLISAAFAVFAYVSGNIVFAKYLFMPYVPGVGELCILLGSMVGAGLGFLWFNTHPAKVFMGDVGALSLGAALGLVAVILRQEIVLFIMGGVFVAETISVMLQVSYFKYTKRKFGEGRRLFKMAPLHHHFEQSGWKETQVVVRFWIITIILVLIGLSTLKLR